MALLSIGAIKEITGVSWTVMFPEGYSERLSSGAEDNDAVVRSFHSMAVLVWRSLVPRDLLR